MKIYSRILFIVVLILTISSCKVITGLWSLKMEKAKVYSYNLNNTEIKFIPMHHLGKKEFYDDVKEKIKKLKNEGYVVYYELISTKMEIDSVEKDLIRRKVRKIKGFSGNYKDAVKGTFFEKYILQPSYKDLGITANDKRADINYLQFINEWEKINGIIVLDSIDMNTDFDKKYKKGDFYTNKQYKNIVIKFRNKYLIDLIKSSKSNKILVIYGEGHRKDFKKQIKRINTLANKKYSAYRN